MRTRAAHAGEPADAGRRQLYAIEGALNLTSLSGRHSGVQGSRCVEGLSPARVFRRVLSQSAFRGIASNFAIAPGRESLA